MDAQSRPSEFSSEGFGGALRLLGKRSAPRCEASAAHRVHFPTAERHDRFSGGQKAASKVGVAFAWHCYRLACPDPLWGPRSRRVGRLPGSCLGFDWRGLVRRVCRPPRVKDLVSSRPYGSVATGSYSTRPVLKHGPRSLTCARVVGLYETRRRSESEGFFQRGSGVIPGFRIPGRNTGPSRPRCR